MNKNSNTHLNWLGKTCIRTLMAVLVLTLSLQAIAAPYPLSPEVMVEDGVQGDVRISPDGLRAVYRVHTSTSPLVSELYSVSVYGGGGEPVKLSGSMVPGGRVSEFRISSDGQSVVFRADREVKDKMELYCVPISGGALEKLNAGMGNDRRVGSFLLSPTQNRLVYSSNEQTLSVSEIYSVGLNGQGRVKLNEPLSPGSNFQDYDISLDGSKVVYRIFFGTGLGSAMFQVPIAGGASVRISGDMVPGGAVVNTPTAGRGFSPNNQRFLYLATQESTAFQELFSAAMGGGSVKINGPLVTGGNVAAGSYRYSPDSSRVLYAADQEVDGRFELYSASGVGGGVVKLNGPLASGGNVWDYLITPDSNQVVFRANGTITSRRELYVTPILGGGVIRLNSTMVTSGLSSGIQGFELTSDGRKVVYRADQDVYQRYGIYVVNVNGTGDVVKLDAELPEELDGELQGNWTVRSMKILPGDKQVAFVAHPVSGGPDQLFVVSIEGGEPRRISQKEPPEESLIQPLFTTKQAGQPLLFLYSPSREFGARRELWGVMPGGDASLISLGKKKGSLDEPPDTELGSFGLASINGAGNALFELGLLGSGASRGRNRAMFDTLGVSAALAIQSGTPLDDLGSAFVGLKATRFFSPAINQAGRGIFQASLSGPGGNRAILVNDGTNVMPVLRTGVPMAELGGAAFSRIGEMAQHHTEDSLAVCYTLKRSSTTGVASKNDTGILLMKHDGSVRHSAAREGQPTFDFNGVFGQFPGQVAMGDGEFAFFIAPYIPNGERKAVQRMFQIRKDGSLAFDYWPPTGSIAAGVDNDETFSKFLAVNERDFLAVLRATLKGGPVAQREGIWNCGSVLWLRKGVVFDSANLPGIFAKRILKFWPVGADQLVVQVVLGGQRGAGVTGRNNQALLLRQGDESWRVLLRSGDAVPGAAPTTVSKISAVDVDRVNGHYAVLGTLRGAPSSANQALWTGQTSLGGDDLSETDRLPVLRLRKGGFYSSELTASGVMRSLALKPLTHPGGAGARGQGQVIGAGGHVVLTVIGDRNVSELVVLEP